MRWLNYALDFCAVSKSPKNADRMVKSFDLDQIAPFGCSDLSTYSAWDHLGRHKWEKQICVYIDSGHRKMSNFFPVC